MSERRGRLIVVTGPSGVGKDTVLRELFAIDPDIAYSVSYTTRAPRPGEVDGVSYWFVSEPEFRAMIERDEFFEWSTVYGELKGRSFASIERALESGRDTVIKIDVQGAQKVRARLGKQALYIFIVPPSLEALERRLIDRGTESDDSLRRRRDTARYELTTQGDYDHVVVNDDAARAAAEIARFLAADRVQRGVAHA